MATAQRLPPREAQPPASTPAPAEGTGGRGKAARAAFAAPTCSRGGVSAGALGSDRGERMGPPPHRRSTPAGSAERSGWRRPLAGPRLTGPLGRLFRALPAGGSAARRQRRRRRPSTAAASLPGPAGPAPAPSPSSGRGGRCGRRHRPTRGRTAGKNRSSSEGGRRLPAAPAAAAARPPPAGEAPATPAPSLPRPKMGKSLTQNGAGRLTAAHAPCAPRAAAAAGRRLRPPPPPPSLPPPPSRPRPTASPRDGPHQSHCAVLLPVPRCRPTMAQAATSGSSSYQSASGER